MSAERRGKLQAWLYETFPIYRFIALELAELGDAVRCRAPLTADNRNHFGVMHAGVLFTLAEATAGVAIGQHRDLGAMTLIAISVEFEFKRVAKTAVDAVVRSDEAFADRVRAGIAQDPHHRFEVAVDLLDADGRDIAHCKCMFQLRPRR